MFRFIHAADIHLDSPLKGLQRYESAPVEEIRLATRRAMENLIELAIEREVDFVLIAGDLYDGEWTDFNTGLWFVGQMVKLREAGVPVVVVSGNHDAASKMTRSLPLPENVTMLSHKGPETVRLDDVGVAIHGQSFASAKVSENVVGGFPAAVAGCFNIGLLHTSLDSETEEEHARYAPCKVSDLAAKGYDYWALGHIHKRWTSDGDVPIVFPGNIQGRHIRETGEKGCMLVSVDDRGVPEIEFRPLDVFRWEVCHVDANGAEDGDEVLARFASELARLIEQSDGRPTATRVIVRGSCAAHRQLAADPIRWTGEIRARAIDVSSGSVWVEKVKFQTTEPRTLDRAALTDGPIGEILEYIGELREDDERLVQLAGELESLFRKLPDELRRGADALAWDNADLLREVLREVEPMLLGRLLSQEGER